MAITKIDWKETGKKFSEAMNKIKSTTKTTATAIALALWTASCDWHPMTVSVFSGAQWDYESGETERAIQEEEKELETLDLACKEYKKEYKDLQNQYLDALSRGDTQAAKQSQKSMSKLDEVIDDLEQKINGKKQKRSELRLYYIRGQEKFNKEYPLKNPPQN